MAFFEEFNLGGGNIGRALAGYQVPTAGTQTLPGNVPGNLDVGFPGLTGAQTVPAEKPGFFQNMAKNPELLAMALDQLGGIVNPYQGSEGLGTRLAKSSLASKAAQQQQAKLTLPDQKGPTSESRKKVPGGTQVTSITFEPDDDTLGGQLATRP